MPSCQGGEWVSGTVVGFPHGVYAVALPRCKKENEYWRERVARRRQRALPQSSRGFSNPGLPEWGASVVLEPARSLCPQSAPSSLCLEIPASGSHAASSSSPRETGVKSWSLDSPIRDLSWSQILKSHKTVWFNSSFTTAECKAVTFSVMLHLVEPHSYHLPAGVMTSFHPAGTLEGAPRRCHRLCRVVGRTSIQWPAS